MGKYHIFQEITEFAPKILKTGEIYEMCWLEALHYWCTLQYSYHAVQIINAWEPHNYNYSVRQLAMSHPSRGESINGVCMAYS